MNAFFSKEEKKKEKKKKKKWNAGSHSASLG
jgi:hypothetical protein